VAVEKAKIKEKFKIEAAKETLQYLLDKNAKVALISHLGRPDGKVDPEFSFKDIASEIQEILGVRIKFVGDCVGEKVQEGLNNLQNDEVMLLENVRFYPEEEKNEPGFAKELADGFDIFINGAFSVSHRDQASVTGIMKFLPSFAGFRLQKEIEEMEKIKNNFARPAVAIIGGAKIETKLPVIKFFENIYDHILVGGKIANEATDEKINFSEKVIIAWDFVDGRSDIGTETLFKFKEIIALAKTIVWNGPLGKIEEEKFAVGSDEILKAIIASGAYTVVGGGETLEVLEKNNAMDRISFVSTGGGAMLDYLSGEKMPGIDALKI
jgi:3-phosphoglycerate kinase